MSKDYILNISAMESICGLKTEIPIFIPAVCNKCEGSRSELGYQVMSLTLIVQFYYIFKEIRFKVEKYYLSPGH